MGFTVAFLNMPCLYLSASQLLCLMVLAPYYWALLSLTMSCAHTQVLGSEDNLKYHPSASVYLSLRGPYRPGTHYVGPGGWLAITIVLPASASADLGFQALPTHSALEIWVLEEQTQVLTCVWEALSWPSFHTNPYKFLPVTLIDYHDSFDKKQKQRQTVTQ